MTSFAEGVWFSSFLLSALLTFLCFWQKRFKTDLFFCIWIASSTVIMFVLYGASRLSAHAYGLTYVTMNVIDELLQMLVVYGFARNALQYEGRWLSDSRQRFLGAAILASVFAALVETYAEIASASSVDRLLIRLNLPGAVFICVLMLQLLWLSFSDGFIGTLFQRRCFAGYVLWTFANCLSETLRANLIPLRYTDRIDTVLTVVVGGLLCYWIVVFMLPQTKYRAEFSHSELGDIVVSES